MIRLRDYQQAAVQSIYDYFGKQAGDPLIAMPTGTGKSVVIAGFLHGIYQRYPTQRVMIVTHVKELIEQNFDKLVRLWPTAPAGINSAGLGRRDTQHKIIFAGIGSVYKTPAEFGRVDLLLIDEAHLVGPNDTTRYQKFIQALRAVNPFLKVIGFTATPWRLGFGHIADGEEGLFDDVCFDLCTVASFNWLIDQGYLCTLTPKRTKTLLDTAGVHKVGGDFNQKELQLAVDKREVTERAVEEMLAGAAGRHSWMAFCAGVDHAKHVADVLNYNGIKTVAVHTNMGDKERDRAIAAFKAGDYRCATNNNILTTGFDHPALDFIACLRPTMSSVLWVQLLGRGTRPFYAPGYDLDLRDGRLAAIQASQKHDCLVYDFANNTKRLGPINDPVPPRKKGKGQPGDAPVKVCPACDTWIAASARQCAHCGHEFTFAVKIREHAGTEELVKADMPETKVFAVQNIAVGLHSKVGQPAALRVSYYCGLRHFEEFVDFARPTTRGRAVMWWRERAGPAAEVPTTAEGALEQVSTLRQPTHVRVWTNRKPYPQLLAADFTGTAFGELPAPAVVQVPFVQLKTHTFRNPAAVPDTPAAAHLQLAMDDDIPF